MEAPIFSTPESFAHLFLVLFHFDINQVCIFSDVFFASIFGKVCALEWFLLSIVYSLCSAFCILA